MQCNQPPHASSRNLRSPRLRTARACTWAAALLPALLLVASAPPRGNAALPDLEADASQEADPWAPSATPRHPEVAGQMALAGTQAEGAIAPANSDSGSRRGSAPPGTPAEAWPEATLDTEGLFTFRYGRLVLEDVGAVFTAPARWSGRFINRDRREKPQNVDLRQ